MAKRLTEDGVRARYLKWDANMLERVVSRANRRYENGEPTGISDPLYEALCCRLRTLRPEAPALRISNMKIGAPTVQHHIPMLSLSKASGIESLRTWLSTTESHEIYVTPKVDGIACSVSYRENGHIRYAATRGDGGRGEVITEAVLAAEAVPDRVECGPCEIRGELFVPREDFRTMKGYSCARNAVAGYVKRNTPDPDFPLAFFPYDAFPSADEASKLRLFNEIGFDEPLHWILFRGNALFSFVYELRDQRAHWPFDADGLVFRVASQSEFDALGATAHHPRGAIALKFDDDLAETIVTSVTWDVSRTGTVTPVAVFEPTQLAGAMIENATLHHVGMYKAHGIRPGSRIAIARRGGVIPHVHAVLENPERPQDPPPDTCPSCLGQLVLKPSSTSSAEQLVCSDPDRCPGAMQARIIHFASTIGIKGLGPKITEDLFEKRKLIDTPDDLYDLDTLLPKKGRKKVEQKLIAQIEEHRKVPFSLFLAALGLDHVGLATARMLASKFDHITFFTFSSKEDLEDLPGIGPIAAKSICEELSHRMPLITSLLDKVEIIEERKASNRKGGKFPSSPFVGSSILFTGALEIKRSEAEALAANAGAFIAKGVTRELDFLVTSDPESTSSKMRKARDHLASGAKITILTEAEFLEKLP